MKVDGLGVVLAIILLPIILVVTFYIQMQVDTIATENSYNTILLNATYNAMSAFEINTANEKLSSVADSMRSIVLASNNTFLNTLATDLGISNANKEYLQPYIPAVLYTMYDGYYIYAPTETAKVAEKTEKDDGTGLITTKGYISVGDERTDSLGGTFGDIVYEKEDGSYTIDKNEAKQEKDYILKSYVQYSARYKKGNPDRGGKDVTINYTLDNYLNIAGKVNGVYYTKTGYLIKKDLVSKYKIGNNEYSNNNLYFLNEDDAKNEILGLKPNANEVKIEAKNSSVTLKDGTTISYIFSNGSNGIKEIVAKNTKNDPNDHGIQIKTISEAETYLKMFYEKYEENKENDLLNDIQTLEYEIQKAKAVAYYVSSACFSNWVYTNLDDLMSSDIQDNAMTGYYEETDTKKYESSSDVNDLYYDFTVNPIQIFDGKDPEDPTFNFNTHKMEVIKNSIKYNLNLSMSAYHNIYSEYEASMPVLLDEEWDKILSNISIVSFMQGWDCGLHIYNNYQIVSSTNNELTVTPSEIYYVKKEEFDNQQGSYHRIDCPYLSENNDYDAYIAFKSKEVKYDKVYDKASDGYQFDHKNLACYTCINTNNYDSLFADPQNTQYYEKINSLKKSLENNDTSVAKKRAAYIGLAKERQNIYKTNALPVSEGYKVFNNNNAGWNSSNDGKGQINNINLSELSELQITLKVTKNQVGSGSVMPVWSFNIGENGGNNNGTNQDIRLTQTTPQTLIIDVTNWTGNGIKIGPNNLPINYEIQYKIESIKAIYK